MMPYALKNKETSELFSCALENIYGSLTMA